MVLKSYITVNQANDAATVHYWDSPGDTQIVNKARNQLAEATDSDFVAFYETNYDQLARALAWTLGNTSLATEALDEAMVRAYTRWDEVSKYSNPQGWVYRVGLNWGRSFAKKLKRPHQFFGEDEQAPAQFENQELWQAIRSLPKDFRAVVVLRYFADWSTNQTAEALQIAPGTVKSRLNRAHQKLENVLEKGES